MCSYMVHGVWVRGVSAKSICSESHGHMGEGLTVKYSLPEKGVTLLLGQCY